MITRFVAAGVLCVLLGAGCASVKLAYYHPTDPDWPSAQTKADEGKCRRDAWVFIRYRLDGSSDRLRDEYVMKCMYIKGYVFEFLREGELSAPERWKKKQQLINNRKKEQSIE